MAVLKKIRSRLWAPPTEQYVDEPELTRPVAVSGRYDIRPLTVSHLEDCWRLDQRCFVDGEAYSRETFEYLLTAPESVSYRAATPAGAMVGFVIGLIEPDHTGHITTVGVAPEHRRRHLGQRLMAEVEKGFKKHYTVKNNQQVTNNNYYTNTYSNTLSGNILRYLGNNAAQYLGSA